MDEPEIKKTTIADMEKSEAKTQTDAPPQQPQPEAKPEPIKPESLFFNVMPKIKNQGNVVQPTLKIQPPVVETIEKKEVIPPQVSSFFLKNKLYVIIAAVILILGPITYYFVNKYIASSYQSQTLLVNNGLTPLKPASSTSTPQSQNPNFSTPQQWRDKYFPNCSDQSLCGDQADPDHDGLNNLKEFQLGTDPNNPDSDQDGISDGDEVNVFGTNPLNPHSANDSQYSDSDYIKGGYDVGTGKQMTPQQITTIAVKMKNFGLHEPTLKTLGNIVNSLYSLSAPLSTSTTTSIATSTPAAATSSASSIDQSITAKQDRDTKRSNTISNIETALVKYQSDNKTYPTTNDFGTMFAQVKPYLKVATNPADPINQAPYVYSYTASSSPGTDFTLTFYSEVAGQVIKKHAADAQKDSNAEQASIYDNQRQLDLESIRTALLLYSQNNVAGNQTYVFPTTEKYKTAIVPDYIEQIPKDPKTGQDYLYQVSESFNTFTIKTILDNPAPGTTGYLCNQEECTNY